jgi:hypothetical protein
MKSRKFRLEIVGPLLLACFSICTSALAQEKEEPKKAPSGADSTTAGEDRKTHVRLGGFSIGAGYSHYSGPYYYDPYYYPFYPAVWGLAGTFWSPFYDLYSPLYRPGPYWQYSPSAGMGEVKLQGTQKSAEVFLNGAYAGITGDLKSIWLEPGAYDLEVKAGHQRFSQRIYVLSGKSLKIRPALNSKTDGESP